MSAPASASLLALSNPPARRAEPSREGRWRRVLRWVEDRRHLRAIDDRLLRDVGLTREDVLRGVPFRDTAPRPGPV